MLLLSVLVAVDGGCPVVVIAMLVMADIGTDATVDIRRRHRMMMMMVLLVALMF